ncbi:related to MCD4-sporulation protein [Sporisorium reilianum f. sp. reilianum]|uniref:GPI ethanolamine phosphate transferase 1 n=1 Tax=Sporisorium reilianum f. sp. reilianum TaxID=72559 RepID=A0A2N8U731_9BASI|nr:related to MCD4-sporulation protein [Sporisorium reilianum f. sp. reilianum]
MSKQASAKATASSTSKRSSGSDAVLAQAVPVKVKSPRKVSAVRFLLLNLLFHVIYISSIFDIYFTSPVVHPEPRFSVKDTLQSKHSADHLEAPAKRLVLIVGDGLRADTLFKRHTSDLLPAWSITRDGSYVKDGSMGSWASFDKHALSQPYPYPLALESTKSPDAVQGATGSIPDAAFAAPFLRSVARHRGAWGLSHTRVPTESRPGHVAMIAGMYEDVSAVTKGWKLNPIAFDSLLNQSSHSFAFGSPDIVPMFAVGAAADRVDMWTYDEEDEDFTKDATHLDLWVLDRFKSLLDRAQHDKELDAKMQQPGTVFFLHLLGLDTTGHTYRPLSSEYVGNTIVVDAITREVEKLMDDYYQNDGRTAYVFTADHGMSVKGNHGDGDPDNTRTPLVAWGAGVRGPRAATLEQKKLSAAESREDAYFADWHLEDVARADVDQADITPLMSTLLGVPVPANSEGRLRLDLVDLPEEHKARALLANAQQVLETYRVKHKSRARRMVRYTPFGPLSQEAGEKHAGEKKLAQIMLDIEQGDFEQAVVKSNGLIDDAIQGAHYLQTYDWLLLCSIVAIGYLGSMIHAFTFLLRSYILPDEVIDGLAASTSTGAKKQPSLLKVAVAPLSGAVFALFAAQEMPISYYLYAALAFLFWGRIVDEAPLFGAAYHHVARSKGGISIVKTAVMVLSSLAILELMAIGYLYRVAWFIGFVLLGFAWPSFALTADFKADNEGLILVWGLSCLMTGLFTIGDVNKEESILLLMLSAVIFLGAGCLVVSRPLLFFSKPNGAAASMHDSKISEAAQVLHSQKVEQAHSLHLGHTLQTLRVQLGVLVVTAVTTAVSVRSLRNKHGLPLATQALAWISLVTCLVFPFAYGFRRAISVQQDSNTVTRTTVRQSSSQRLAIVVFAFAPVFVLLSLRDEVLFFGCYTVTLLVWAKMEGSLHELQSDGQDQQPSGGRRLLELPELRVSLFYLFFLHVGFFGTGNVASISSFYLSPVYRLVPIFNPFLMATLLLLKILVPFLILNAVFSLLATTPRLASTATAAKTIERGFKLLGETAPGGLGLDSALSLVFGAGIAADVLALNFLFAVKSEGSWLEIGQTITHFVMANLLQIFMLALAAASSAILGRA